MMHIGRLFMRERRHIMNSKVKNLFICLFIIIGLFASPAGAGLNFGGGLNVSGGFEAGKTNASICTLGDSLSFGAHETRGVGWREPLFDLLGASYIFVGNLQDRQDSGGVYYDQPEDRIQEPDFTNYGWHSGISGSETAHIEARVVSAVSESFQDVITERNITTLYIGINDIIQDGEGADNEADYVQNVVDIVRLYFAGNPNKELYVALIAPTDGTQSWIDTSVVVYNGLLDTALQTEQITYSNLYIVDIYTAFVNVSNCATIEDCIGQETQNSTVHFSDQGYQVAAQEFYEAIIANE